MTTHDVIVIGAGLSGLRCASQLALAGRSVVVLEATDGVGGRQRTDVVDGFLLDRGFQLLNPAYPAVRRWVDVQALRVQALPVGVRVLRDSGWAELWHPLRHPDRLPATLRGAAGGLIAPSDPLALARWLVPVLLRPRAVIAGPDRPLGAGWDRVGLRGPLRREVLEPFFAGVLAENLGDAAAARTGSTSDAFARLLARMFALGRPGVPERGMGAIPAQLATVVRAAGAEIRLEHRVTALRATEAGRVDVSVAGADPFRAGSVVVATGPGAFADLLDLPRPRMGGLQTWWFAADSAPTASALLHVDGRRHGPVLHAAVMSHAAPSYAPPGRHLVEATCLLAAAASEADVRRQLAEMFGSHDGGGRGSGHADASGWDLLRRDDIAQALPLQSAPLRTTTPARLSTGVYVAGDHRDTASIQGALVSGDRVARAVLRAG